MLASWNIDQCACEFANEIIKAAKESIPASWNIDQCACEFANEIIKAAKESIPNKVVTIQPLKPKWINGHVKRQIKQRKRLFRKTKRTNNESIWHKFRRKAKWSCINY